MYSFFLIQGFSYTELFLKCTKIRETFYHFEYLEYKAYIKTNNNTNSA